MTWFSDKMLNSITCICGLMPNLIRKSWTVSIQGLPHVYEIIIVSLPSFDWIDNIDNNTYSYTGMSFKLKRKNLGYLSSSFYYPTASFALLSMISFLVKPDAVSFLKKLLCFLYSLMCLCFTSQIKQKPLLFVTIMSHNDELSWSMSWVGHLLTTKYYQINES